MGRYGRYNAKKKKEPRWDTFLRTATDILGANPRVHPEADEMVSTDHILILKPPAGKASKLLKAWYDDCEPPTDDIKSKAHDNFIHLTDKKFLRGKVMLSLPMMKKVISMMEATGEESISISVYQGEQKEGVSDYAAPEWANSMPALITGPSRESMVLIAPIIPTG